MRNFLVLLFLASASLVGATEIVGTPEITRSGDEATVRWRTDVACGTRAKLEPNANLIEPGDRTPTTEHSIKITGLQPNVAYQLTLGTARKWLTTQPLAPGGNAPPNASPPPQTTARPPTMNTRASWGNPSSLPDHFARHGHDFGATSPEDYARQAAEFLQRAKTEGLPAKRTPDGVLRVFDPKTGAFAAYNRNGTTKTFFKPGRPGYFEHQPGSAVDLRHQP